MPGGAPGIQDSESTTTGSPSGQRTPAAIHDAHVDQDALDVHALAQPDARLLEQAGHDQREAQRRGHQAGSSSG
jgi:hypothetical protein